MILTNPLKNHFSSLKSPSKFVRAGSPPPYGVKAKGKKGKEREKEKEGKEEREKGRKKKKEEKGSVKRR